jgi:hypothetical protein
MKEWRYLMAVGYMPDLSILLIRLKIKPSIFLTKSQLISHLARVWDSILAYGHPIALAQ